MHPDLRYAGMLPPLDAPHHLRAAEWGPYREGVVRETNNGAAGGSFIDIGLEKDAYIPRSLKPGARVTLHLGDEADVEWMDGWEVYKGRLVSPSGTHK